jgi:uncharacterized protein YjiS (DUF1127 family)
MYRFHNLDGVRVPAVGAIRQQGAPALVQAEEILIRVLDRLAEWQERAEQRQRLLTLDDRMLADIGTNRVGALIEAEKRFCRP